MARLLSKLRSPAKGGDVAEASRKPLTLTRKKREVLKLKSNDDDGDKVVTVVTKRRRRVVKPPVQETKPVEAPAEDEPAIELETVAQEVVDAPVMDEAVAAPIAEEALAEPVAEAVAEQPVEAKPEAPAKADAPNAEPVAAPSESDRRKAEHAKKKKRKRPEATEEPASNWDGFAAKRGKGPVSKGAASKDKRRRGGQRQAPAPDVASNKHAFERPTAPVIREVVVPEMITVADLAQKMSLKSVDLIKKLMQLGIMATINQPLDQDTAVLVVEELGHKAVARDTVTLEETLDIDYEGEECSRAAIVTIMGHVDHGKTSLLDYIRRTKVADKEAGGITQHIGAYHVNTARGMITFLDTPGHAAFSAMRARGAQTTDVCIIVVAADDGVKPQTVEAIQHAKAANVPIIVAINKVDKPEADLERVRNELSQHEVISEDWGGDTQFVPVSAKSGQGIDELLDAILVLSELLELKAIEDCPAKGVVVESSIEKGRGPVATVLVQSGTLRVGDFLLCGVEYGRVRAMVNELGRKVTEAKPSIPVQVLGLSGSPGAGEECVVVPDERKAREVAVFRQNKERESRLARQQASKLENFMGNLNEGEVRTLNVVLKADVQGSVEALAEALEQLSTDEVKVQLVVRGVGGLNASDINLAIASQGFVIGFNVRADSSARKLAQQEGVSLHYFSIIYDVIDDLKKAISGLSQPKFRENILGLAEVRDVFRHDKFGAIAGCLVVEGTIYHNRPIRVLRDNVVIYEGVLESLRRFKDDVTEVKSGTECGIGVKNYNDVKVGDQIEVFESVQIEVEV